MNPFAFQLTDSSFIMPDHLLHGVWLISISPGSQHQQSVSYSRIHPSILFIHPSIVCSSCPLYPDRSASLHTLGKRLGNTRGRSAVYYRLTHFHTLIHTWGCPRLRSIWPACLWSAVWGNQNTQRRNLVKLTQVEFCLYNPISHKTSQRAFQTHNSSRPSVSSRRKRGGGVGVER